MRGFGNRRNQIMKTTIIILLLFLTNCLVGQSYSFTEIESPNPDRGTYSVHMIGEKGFAGGGNYSCYYNGEELIEVLQPINYSLGYIGGFEREDGTLYAFQDNFYRFYQWDNSAENWVIIPKPALRSFMGISVLAENNVYLCAVNDNDMRYGGIYHYNGNSFTELTYNFNYSYREDGIYAKTDNNILLITSDYSSGRLIRFDGTNLETVYTFPVGRGGYSMTTFDGNIFFFLSSFGDVYKWDDSTEIMEQLYAYPDGEKEWFARSVFATDNNNLFIVGYGGIRHMNVSTRAIDLVYEEWDVNKFFWDASYANGKAFIATNDGRLIKMTISSSIDPETVSQLAIYPNPATDILSIEFPVFGINDKTIEILDLNGKIVATTQFSSFKVNMDISGLSNGVYFLRLSCEEGLITKKFIKYSNSGRD